MNTSTTNVCNIPQLSFFTRIKVHEQNNILCPDMYIVNGHNAVIYKQTIAI